MTEKKPPRVFISYAQDEGLVCAWVRDFSKRLGEAGLDPILDQTDEPHPRGLVAWIEKQFRSADVVLCICNEAYKRHFESPDDVTEKGLGVAYEAGLIRDEIFRNKGANQRIVAVLPPSGRKNDVPSPLGQYLLFAMEAQFSDLVRRLLNKEVRSGADNKNAGGIESSAMIRIANPYPGLAAFKPAQHEFFFGRDNDTQRVLDKLKQTGFASIVGGSGTGKSSLMAAGVVPALLRTTPGAVYLRFKPQNDPLRQLAEAIDRQLPEEKFTLGKKRVERLLAKLEVTPGPLIDDAVGPLGTPLLVFIDQFEELFTQTPPERAEAFRGVLEALRRRAGLNLVLTLRHEFMPRLMDWLGGAPFADSLLPLDPIRDEQRLRAIITGPADKAGVPVQPELLAELLPAARAMAGALPLLALALEKLFAAGDPQLGLTLDAYRAMGGLAGIVETAAAPIDQAIDADPALLAATEKLFAELATVIDDLPTRRTAPSAPLRADPQAAILLDALRSQGFLADPDPEHVELAHETLLLHWPRLQQWCDRYADKLALRRQAEHAALEWSRASYASAAGAGLAPGQFLHWGWERQRPALMALLALQQLEPQPDPEFTDPGIHAWRGLEARLPEPLRSFLEPEPLALLRKLANDQLPHHQREDFGRRLEQMGDPRRGVGLAADGLPDIAWVAIPAGEVTLESDPPATFPVAPFRIARYPVTWQQYGVFLRAEDGFSNPLNWATHRVSPGKQGGPS
jgi:conflict system STAND superfamily ATPase/SEFIR domain-containing protein